MKLNRIAIIAGASAVLAAGAGAAVAATSEDEAKEREQAVLEDAADRLGTTPQELREALGSALDAQLDEAVRDGRLTQEQADEIKQRRQESGTVLGFPGGPGRFHHHHGGPGGGPGLIEEVAGALGISERQLFDRLRAGRTLAQIAEAEDTSIAEVKRKVRAAVEADLDQAIEDGDITREQADERLEHLDEHLDRLGTLRGGRFDRRGGPPPMMPPHEG